MEPKQNAFFSKFHIIIKMIALLIVELGTWFVFEFKKNKKNQYQMFSLPESRIENIANSAIEGNFQFVSFANLRRLIGIP